MVPNSGSTSQGDRTIRRTKQACENCRRKKTRCSGERPVCRFCSRLNQTCVYNTRLINANFSPEYLNSCQSTTQEFSTIHPNIDIGARLAAIEARLGLIRQADQHENSINEDVGLDIMQASPESALQPNENDATLDLSNSANDVDGMGKFTRLPPWGVLHQMVDVYFASCHNQPYCFFREDLFRQRLEENALPDHLLLAFIATAARYSTHSYFEDRKHEAIETYAKKAWLIILQQVFTSEHGLDLRAVQTTNLLAVIDFTAGQHRLGWIKIGLVTRFAQGLKLNIEPDPALPSEEQEEHRRVFWSVYVLDRFVCFRGRSPSILDAECSVRLPSAERASTEVLTEESPTLAVLDSVPEISACRQLNHFALLVIASAFLGRVIKCSVRQASTKSYPPWDFRSDCARTSTMLHSFEILLSIENMDLAQYIKQKPSTQGDFDSPWAGHFIWSRGVYHLACCLLHHPLFLYRHLHEYKDRFPLSFVRSSLRTCYDHAQHLTSILKLVLDTGCCVRGSFLGYFAVVAGSVHRLYEHSSDLRQQTRSQEQLRICYNFLEEGLVYWDNYPRMAAALNEFQVDESTALTLIEPRLDADTIELTALVKWSSILDYGWLCDANRVERLAMTKTPQDLDFRDWGYFGEPGRDNNDGSFDIVGSGMDSLLYDRGETLRDWLFDNNGGNAMSSLRS